LQLIFCRGWLYSIWFLFFDNDASGTTTSHEKKTACACPFLYVEQADIIIARLKNGPSRHGVMTGVIDNLENHISDAVAHYWRARKSQREKQKNKGFSDAGLRSAVTGGAQMDGFVRLFTQVIVDAGISEKCVFRKRLLELPGFFRPTKEWDLLVVKNGQLVAAIEAKSQVGPSFGNNFNNRTEEAMGSALDLWTAYREGAFNGGVQPFLGYFFMLEDCDASIRPVKVKEPHFKVFPEFVGASYMKR